MVPAAGGAGPPAGCEVSARRVSAAGGAGPPAGCEVLARRVSAAGGAGPPAGCEVLARRVSAAGCAGPPAGCEVLARAAPADVRAGREGRKPGTAVPSEQGLRRGGAAAGEKGAAGCWLQAAGCSHGRSSGSSVGGWANPGRMPPAHGAGDLRLHRWPGRVGVIVGRAFDLAFYSPSGRVRLGTARGGRRLLG